MSSSHVIFKIIIIKIINIKINWRCVCAATERGYGARLNPVITSNTPHCKFSVSFIKIFQSFTVFLPSSTSQQCSIDISKYRQPFSNRMDMAGIKPHHRIGLLLFSYSSHFTLTTQFIYFWEILLFVQFGVCPFYYTR